MTHGTKGDTRMAARGEMIKSVPLFLRTEVEGVETALAVIGDDPRFESLGIRWNARLVSCAGRVNYLRSTGLPTVIELNPRLKANAAELRETVLHEIGHALAMFRGVDDGHGPMWRACCADLGYRNASRYHSHTSIPNRKARSKVVAYCLTCEREFRGTKLRNQSRAYRCPKCKNTVATTRAALRTLGYKA
jgi:predicted SprT family Zn-dependent metalloprotease